MPTARKAAVKAIDKEFLVNYMFGNPFKIDKVNFSCRTSYLHCAKRNVLLFNDVIF